MQFTQIPQQYAPLGGELRYAVSREEAGNVDIRIAGAADAALLGAKRFAAVTEAAFDAAPYLRRQLRFVPATGKTGFYSAGGRTVSVVVEASETDGGTIAATSPARTFLPGVEAPAGSCLRTSMPLNRLIPEGACDELTLLTSGACAVTVTAEAERIVRLAEQKFAGNPGQVMFVIRDGGEDDNSRFIPIAAQNEGDWQALHEQAVGDIVVAHSWFRTLSGLDYAAGFSAERILHEYEVALNTVILAEQAELTEPIRALVASVLGLDTASLQIVNRPPTRSKPIYMKVWEARKADGLDYDPEDPKQQAFLSEITKYNIKSIE